MSVCMWKTIGKLTTKSTHEIMTRSKFVFHVRDVIRLVMRKSTLSWKNTIKSVSNASKRERKRIEERKKNIHIFTEMEFSFGFWLRALHWLLHSLALCECNMSYHLLSWILVFFRISVISRNDSSFVWFIFFHFL